MLLNCGVGEDSWESFGLQGDQTSQSKGNQSWIIIGKTDAEAEDPVLWPPDAKNSLIRKDPDAGKDECRTEDEVIGWHHQIGVHEFEQALGVGDGQGGLACCSPWGHKESDMTEWLNWTDKTGTLPSLCVSRFKHWSWTPQQRTEVLEANIEMRFCFPPSIREAAHQGKKDWWHWCWEL